MRKLILSIITSLFLITTNAMSFSLSDANLSIGVSGNQAAYYAEGKETASKEDGTVDKQTIEAGAFTDGYGSIFVEIGLSDTVSLGVDYVPEDIKTPENISNEDRSTTQKASATFSELITVYAKIDVPLGGTYLKVGYSQVDLQINEDSSRTYSQPGDTQGITAGIGYEKDMSDNGVSLRLEVTATSFDDVTSNNGVAATGNRNVYDVSDMMGARGTLSLVKTF